MQPANLIVLVLILGAFYLLILRPAKARQRQQLELQRQVEPGVTIMTTSGMFGTVAEVDDESVHLEVAPGTVIRFTKAAIGRVITEPVEDEDDEDVDDTYEDDDAYDADPHDHDGHDHHEHDHHEHGGDGPGSGTAAGDAQAPSGVDTPDTAGDGGSSTTGRPDEPRDRAAG